MAIPSVQTFKDLVPKATDSLCESMVRAGQFDVQWYNFFKSWFKEDGSFTDDFKARVCALQCVPTPTSTTTPTTTTTATTLPGATTTTTSTTTAACVSGVNYGNISPMIFESGAVSTWAGGASLPPGYYRIQYVSGSIKYASGTGWCINRTGGTGFRIVQPGALEIDGPFITYAGQSSQANVEAANAGAYVDFYHAGGYIGMRLNDDGIYSDNISQISAPAFSLVSLCDPAGDSNQNVIINPTGIGSPYPSKRVIQGMSTSITSIKVTVTALHHSFPDEVQLLLQSPTGQTVVLMAGCGGANAIDPYSPVTIEFDDAAGSSLPDTTAISSGSFKPTKFGFASFPSPAPAGPWGTDFTDFIGTNPNGVWKLWVNDGSPLDGGRIGKWELEITAS